MALPVIAVVRTVDSDRITHPLGAALVAEVKEHDVALVVFLALAVLGGKIVQAFTEQRITNQTAVKAVLDSAHKVYFVDVAKVDQEQLYQHRVTLFKARSTPSRSWFESVELEELEKGIERAVSLRHHIPALINAA